MRGNITKVHGVQKEPHSFYFSKKVRDLVVSKGWVDIRNVSVTHADRYWTHTIWCFCEIMDTHKLNFTHSTFISHPVLCVHTVGLRWSWALHLISQFESILVFLFFTVPLYHPLIVPMLLTIYCPVTDNPYILHNFYQGLVTQSEGHAQRKGEAETFSQESPLTSMGKITLSDFYIKLLSLAKLFLVSGNKFIPPLHILVGFFSFLFFWTYAWPFKIYSAKWPTDKLWLAKVSYILWHRHIIFLLVLGIYSYLMPQTAKRLLLHSGEWLRQWHWSVWDWLLALILNC